VKIWESYTHHSCGIISLAFSDDIVKDHSGGVLEHLQIKIEAVELSQVPVFEFEEDTPCFGRVLIKGPGVVSKYFRNPEAQKELEANGNWLFTGDYAQICYTGAIKILSSVSYYLHKFNLSV
jgi:long-subunit acyl-CoA synthetase (AMP-forming)